MSWVSLQRPSTGDVLAGASVALIVVPQALAYAQLAGMPPATGLTVAAVATIAASVLASSPYLQTGPTAITALLSFGGLSVLATPFSEDYVALAALLAILAGLMRIAIGAGRLGDLAYLMSQPVLDGFMPAAALLIAASQLPALLGVDAEGGILPAAVRAVADVGAWDPATIAVGALTVACVLGARLVHPLLPGVLVAVVVGLLASAVGFEGAVVGPLPAISLVPNLDLPYSRIPDLLAVAAVIALVGFAEVSAIARTFARQTRTPWDANREFVSQGLGNVAAGLFGGFVAGGSFSRSAVNKTAGATSPMSGMVTGLLVLAFVPFAAVVESLPIATLGGIIFASILSLIRTRPIVRLRGYSRPQLIISLTTLVLTLALSPRIQIGIIVGVAMSIAWHLHRELGITTPQSFDDDGVLHLRPRGVLYFGSAHRLEDDLTDALAAAPEVQRVIIHCDGLGRVDVTGALAMRSLVERAAEEDIHVELADFTVANRKILTRVLPPAHTGG